MTQIDLPGVPLFLLQVRNDDLLVGGGSLEFESTDCTGQPWLPPLEMTSAIWGAIARITDASGQSRLFYVADPTDGPLIREIRVDIDWRQRSRNW